MAEVLPCSVCQTPSVQVPDDAPTDNNVSVEITIAGVKSNTVTIAVQ